MAWTTQQTPKEILTSGGRFTVEQLIVLLIDDLQSRHGFAVDEIPGEQLPPFGDLCSQIEWRYERLDEGPFGRLYESCPGVYRIFGLSREGSPAPQTHPSGIDHSGTLYVGESINLQTRLNDLRREKGKHSVLQRLRDRSWPLNWLGVAIWFTHRMPTVSVERCLKRAHEHAFGRNRLLNRRN